MLTVSNFAINKNWNICNTPKPCFSKTAFTGDVFIKSPDKVSNKTVDISPRDIEYKKRLIALSGLENIDFETLSSIAGPDEFFDLVSKHTDDENFYHAGIRPDDKKDIPDSYQLDNVENKTFGANFHIHTTCSDGLLTVQNLLDAASVYADKYVEQNNEKFTIGITDHNTVSGCEEAVEILAKNPEKYKNLRVVLGVEISAKENEIDGYKYKKPAKYHILSLCVNPFDEDVKRFFKDLNGDNKTPMYPKPIGVQEAIDGFKTQPDNYFSYAHPLYPNIRKRIEQGDDPYLHTKKMIQHFMDCAKNKALYLETYYDGYYGIMSQDEKLNQTVADSAKKYGLYNAGGIDTHGTSIFYNGVKEIKAKKEAAKKK